MDEIKTESFGELFDEATFDRPIQGEYTMVDGDDTEVIGEDSVDEEETPSEPETEEAVETETNDETPNEENIPEEAEEPAEDTAPQVTEDKYELKHLSEVQTVDREKVIELAQKGLDYDRIRADRDTTRAENEELRTYKEFLQELADSSKMTIEQLMDETRADVISHRDGTRKEVALKQVREARESRKSNFTQKSLEEARQADYQRFSETHPNLDPKDIPAEVWQRMNDNNLLLSEAYAPIDIANTKAALEAKERELKAKEEKIAALEQNMTNASRSTGSRKSDGATAKPKSAFSEAWDAWKD